MSEDARLAQLTEGIAAFNRGDPQPALGIMADGVECFVEPRLMNAGTYFGHDGYREMLTGWGDAWGSVTAEPVSIEEVDGDHLLIEVLQRAVGAGSGVPVQMTIFWLFQFADGTVIRFHLYSDREAAMTAIRK
jgi:ketosteroid isomerase-like protein